MTKDMKRDGDDRNWDENLDHEPSGTPDDDPDETLIAYADFVDNGLIVTCAVHGEQVTEEVARESGWRLEEEGFQRTVCNRVVDYPGDEL